MSAGAMRARWARMRWRVVPAVVILAGAGLGLMGPASHAAARGVLGAATSRRPAGTSMPVTAYVANSSSGTVTPINTATSTAGPPIMVGDTPQSVAITPDGKTAYVGNTGSGTVTPINSATNTAGPPITVGGYPIAIAITPNGKTVYVGPTSSGTVTPIATATNTAGPPISVGGVSDTPGHRDHAKWQDRLRR